MEDLNSEYQKYILSLHKKEGIQKQEAPQEKEKKILSPYEQMKEEEKEKKNISQVNEFMRRKRYEGKGKFVRKAFEFLRPGGATRISYGRQFPDQQAKIRQLKNQIALMNMSRQAQLRAEQDIFISDNSVVNQIEREVLNNAGSGAANAGDRTAFNLGKEAFNIGNFNFVSPMANVDKEAVKHSKLMIKDPFNNLNAEVDYFSNLVR